MKLKLKPAILLIILCSLVVLGFAAAVGAAIGARNLAESQLSVSMTATADALRSYYDTNPGEYYVDGEGKAYKGDFCISDHPEVVDNILESSGLVSTFFWGDTRKMTSIRNDQNARIIDTKTTDANVLQKVLKDGEAYFNPSLVINGTNYFVVYYPVFQENSKEIIGMTFVGIPDNEVRAGILNVELEVILICVIVMAIATAIAILIVGSIIKAVKATTDQVELIANGDLTQEIEPKYAKRVDEIGEICRSINKLKDSLTDVFSGIKNQTNELVDTSVTLDRMADETARTIIHVETAVEDIANGATTQAQDTQSAQASVMEMGQLIEETVSDVSDLRGNSEKMSTSSTTAMDILDELTDINAKCAEAIALIAEQTNVTNVSAQKIREATDIITSIAEETNLLSLNASIEAARAGDAGRGFAVVADQISKLADQSNKSGHDIELITNDLIADSDKAVATMKEVQEIMAVQSEKMQSTQDAFREVSEGIASSNNSVENINSKAAKLDVARKQIIDIIQSLTAIAEENAASTEETSAAANQVSAATSNVATAAVSLKKITSDLNDDMRKFKF